MSAMTFAAARFIAQQRCIFAHAHTLRLKLL